MVSYTTHHIYIRPTLFGAYVIIPIIPVVERLLRGSFGTTKTSQVTRIRCEYTVSASAVGDKVKTVLCPLPGIVV